ncbi:MAG: pyroglutamyl-peptidase I [Lachnospiraceae bacterium]|nr:pyroglutamyl-peptidase I [Lachnospiraceae bacterium]MBQ1240926.1 pyroglutamyl-peptidase I [Lachnospiraceae bacterium]MBQ2022917.1 pyroglutamyl-peptidase I [Lachnospiraceae bacterium]MBQ2105598.1 pyroglutamyl-peptidase I [Lachnospiraceae bacterium]MBQ2250740.1 pyroglutamyl-peptidase I [Lachnospiraceae bacterium]
MKVLVTGFDPFGGESINPAWEAVKVIKDEIAGAEIVKMQIPTVVGKSIAKIHDKMVEINPDIVIAVGQAGGRFGVTPERVAINVTDARIPDNEGNQPIDEPIFADGDAAYFSNLPVKAMVQEIKNAGYPTSLSNTAGTYICNHVMYGILYYIQKEFPNVRGGFIHVPFAASQVVNKPNTPSMAIADITAAIEAAIKAAVEHQADIKAIGGETH